MKVNVVWDFDEKKALSVVRPRFYASFFSIMQILFQIIELIGLIFHSLVYNRVDLQRSYSTMVLHFFS